MFYAFQKSIVFYFQSKENSVGIPTGETFRRLREREKKSNVLIK